MNGGLPDYVQGILGLLLVVGFFYAVDRLKRYLKGERRYIVDERGERQRVISWNRGQPVYNPKTWQQRVFEEAMLRSERRKMLLAFGLIVGPLIGLGLWLGQQNETYGEVVLGLAAVGSLSSITHWLPALVSEIRYQFGDQSMEGAKVTDKQPNAQPGRELVETQKAHGDAQLASEAEAVALLNSKN